MSYFTSEKKFREDEFIRIAHQCLYEPAVSMLPEYVQRYMPVEDAIRTAFYYALTGNEVSAILAVEDDSICVDELKFSREKVSCRNTKMALPIRVEFELMIQRYGSATNWFLCNAVGQRPSQRFNGIYSATTEIPYFGDYSYTLFADTLLEMSRFGCLPRTLRKDRSYKEMYKEAVCGLLHIMCLDDEEEHFRKTGRLDPDLEQDMDLAIPHLTTRIAVRRKFARKNSDTFYAMVPMLRTFNRMFTGEGYMEYEHDKQLVDITEYMAEYPRNNLVLSRMLRVRQSLFPKRFLSEHSAGAGIKAKKKKLYMETGEIK